jgi:DnaK suppressor protein
LIEVFFKMMGISAGKSIQSRADTESADRRKSGKKPKDPAARVSLSKPQAATARRQEVKPSVKKSKVVSKAAAKSPVKAKPVVKKASAKPVAKAKTKAAVKHVTKAKPATKASVKKPAAKKAVAVKVPAKAIAPSKVKASGKTPIKSVAKPVSKKSTPPIGQSVVKGPAKPVTQAPAKTLTKNSAQANTKTIAKASTKTPAKTPAKTPVKTPSKSPSKAPEKAIIKSVPTPISQAQSKQVATPPPAKPVSTPPVPAKTKAGSRVVPSYAPSPDNLSPHGGNTAAKASFTMSAPVLVPPPQVVIKKDAKLSNNWKAKTAEQLTDQEVIAMPDSEYMNAKQLAFFRLKLVALKNGILSNAGETTEHLREDTSVVPDPADRATIEEEHALELRTRDRERKLLKKIEQSIASIDAEEYGYCDETGEPIGVARLIARPTATLSLEAQQRRELKQKMFGD